ncbi:MAG: transcriptional regulator [Bacteroidales bacterium]|nr:transcriptional regulator [Bacteroidales bacterium]MDT8429947.1 transcriptional regulator [Bacteroidales bacterium]
MDNPIKKLNKDFESRVRLGVMSVLSVNEWVDFNTLKDLLEVTDGNLASHIRSLETSGYLEVRKQFVARKPKTSYNITLKGKKAFSEHLSALEALLK